MVNPLLFIGVCGLISSYAVIRLLSPLIDDYNNKGWAVGLGIGSITVVGLAACFALLVMVMGLTGCTSLATC